MNTVQNREILAAKAGMDAKTARKYRGYGRLPSESAPRWGTRPDPFVDVWEEVRKLLDDSAGLEAKTVFEYLQRNNPGCFQDGQLRTLQRKVKNWRSTNGPSREVFFSQQHHPGRLGVSDFTHMEELGKVPERHRTDRLSTAVNIGAGKFKAGPGYSNPLLGGNQLATGDFNGDGFADLVVQNDVQTEILLGKGDGSFNAGATFNVTPAAVAVGDLNGDHHQDLVVIGSVMQIMLGDGKGNFHLKTTLDSSFGLGMNGCSVHPGAVYIGDLNRDGKMDVALAFSSCTQGAAVFPVKGIEVVLRDRAGIRRLADKPGSGILLLYRRRLCGQWIIYGRQDNFHRRAREPDRRGSECRWFDRCSLYDFHCKGRP